MNEQQKAIAEIVRAAHERLGEIPEAHSLDYLVSDLANYFAQEDDKYGGGRPFDRAEFVAACYGRD